MSPEDTIRSYMEKAARKSAVCAVFRLYGTD